MFKWYMYPPRQFLVFFYIFSYLNFSCHHQFIGASFNYFNYYTHTKCQSFYSQHILILHQLNIDTYQWHLYHLCSKLHPTFYNSILQYSLIVLYRKLKLLNPSDSDLVSTLYNLVWYTTLEYSREKERERQRDRETDTDI